jgi:2-oxo-3-hexenedioate decarboxylase/2-keto-4-pentenoate hydratase
MQGTALARAAAQLVASRLGGGVLDRLPPELTPNDEAEAYRVQAAARPLLEAAGLGRQAGWKVGCTTATMQAFLAIPNPCAGTMFLARMWHGAHRFELPPGRRLGVECEIAVRLGEDLPPRRGGYPSGEVASAVSACMAAIEVVEDRYRAYGELDTATLIADDFFHYAGVLGPEEQDFDPRRLVEVSATMEIEGESVGSGVGSDVLGEPLRVLSWLAESAAAWGTPLRAGEVVLLGSLVQTRWVDAPSRVVVRNDALGEVRAHFVDRPE